MTHALLGPEFNVRDIPFSFSGSWFNISPVIAEHRTAEDLHLISHQNGLCAVLRLTPVAGGDRARTVWSATPARLSWLSEGSGRVDLAYENTDTVRLRGTGLSLRITAAARTLTPFSGAYFFCDPLDGSFHFTLYETGRRYRVTVLSGTAADVAGLEGLGEAERGLTIAGEDGTPWEAVIEEIDSSRPPYVCSVSYDEVVARARAVYWEFTNAIAPWRSSATPAAELACYVLWSATVRPLGFLGRPGVLMSKHWMDKVWSWDHCFNSLALAGGAPALAWDQFHLLFDHQDESGALPDSITHSEVLYNFVKPPIHGWTLRRLRRRMPPLSPAELTETYRRLERWTAFWLDARRAPGQDLPHYQHGNDSGWDNATTFDAARVIIAGDLAAFLILQIRELADLATDLGHAQEADRWVRTADALQRALFDQLWTGERFQARSALTGEPTTSRSLLNLMPIVLGEYLPSQVRARLTEQIRAHLTTYGLATEQIGSPEYQADGYWRGPIWAPATVLIEDGLRRAGDSDLADEVSARFRSLCEASGFAENFDALTGQGLRDRAYTWTASSYLLLAEEHTRRPSRPAAVAVRTTPTPHKEPSCAPSHEG